MRSVLALVAGGITLLSSACGDQLPAGVPAAIERVVMSNLLTCPPSSKVCVTKAGVQSIDVRGSDFQGDHGHVRVWVGVWFYDGGPGIPAPPAHPTAAPGGPPNTLDDEFWLQRTNGRWTVTREAQHGFAPGGGP